MVMSTFRVKVLLVAVTVAISSCITVLALIVGPNQDISNQTALFVEFLMAIFLGIVFWLFQSIENDKIELVLNKQHEILSKLNAREKKHKQNWGEIAQTHLSMILSMLRDLKVHFQALADGKVDQSQLEELRQWANHRYSLIGKLHSPALQEAMLHMVEVLDEPKLYNDIKDSYRQLNEIFRTVPIADIGGIDKQKMKAEVVNVEMNIHMVEQFLVRLKEEMPAEQ